MKVIVCLFLFLNLKIYADGSRILGVFPFAAPSHFFLGSSLMKGLAEKGHDVTIISPFVENNPPKNGTYREIHLTGFREAFEAKTKEISFLDTESTNAFLIAPFFNMMGFEMSEQTLNHTNVQKLVHSNENFDVVIVEQFMNDALKSLATYYQAPLIVFSTLGANPWINHLVGNPSPPSYIPNVFLSYSIHMTLTERVINSLMYLYSEALNNFFVFPSHAKIAKKFFPSIENFDDVLYNASIVLINSHPSTNQPVPYVPNMIDIGGFHVKPSKKLPQDLQKFLDEAKEGVIYFSLGSNLKSSDFPVEKIEALLKAFAKLKQKVLMKWEEDVLPGQPPNVKVSKWFPQQDILAHPNVKLFITHCGLLSTTETIYHGVPVLALPIFGDQKINAHNIVNSGYGLSLSYRELTEERLTEKLNTLLRDSSYAQNAKTRSRIFHDRPIKPLDTTIYWVEYVIRHGGAPHLRVAAVQLPLYQYFLLDVILALLVVVGISTYLFVVLLKKVFRRQKKEDKLKKK